MATNREICTAALRKIGVVAIDEDATPEYLEVARGGLERLLRSWQNREIVLWKSSSLQVPLTSAASYVLTERALDIWSCRLNRNGIETPMSQLSRDQYDELPVKSSIGLPTTFYYDRQSATGTITVWPILGSPNGETLEITYIAPMPDILLDDVASIPPEWEDATVYGLGARLADDFEIRNTFVEQKAQVLLDEALAYDRPTSVRLQ